LFNARQPTPDELPTARELARSTIVALIGAAVVLVTIILPAEYAVDPTGVGRILGLSEMGEIKQQLVEEEEEHSSNRVEQDDIDHPIYAWIAQALVGSAHAQDVNNAELSITLKDGESAEVKVDLSKGQEASYTWTATDLVNFELHVDKPEGGFISYKNGRGVASDEGSLIAAIDGYHGWFWRNRSGGDVTILVRAEGSFSELKRMK
jgi:hypothetical protein